MNNYNIAPIRCMSGAKANKATMKVADFIRQNIDRRTFTNHSCSADKIADKIREFCDGVSDKFEVSSTPTGVYDNQSHDRKITVMYKTRGDGFPITICEILIYLSNNNLPPTIES